MARGGKRNFGVKSGFKKHGKSSAKHKRKPVKRKKQSKERRPKETVDRPSKLMKTDPEKSESEAESETEIEETPYTQLLSKLSETQSTDPFGSDDDEETDTEEDVQDAETADYKETSFVADKTSSEMVNQEPEVFVEDIARKKDDDNSVDPFSLHYERDLPQSLLDVLSSTSPWQTTELHWPHLGMMLVQRLEEKSAKQNSSPETVLLPTETNFVKVGELPVLHKGVSWCGWHVKSQICESAQQANKVNTDKAECSHLLTPFQRELFSIVSSYQDLYYSQRTFNNGEEIRFIYCLHAVNHLLKTSSKINLHNGKLFHQKRESYEYRDQGLTRAKVLIVVPFKQAAFRVVKQIIQILPPEMRDVRNLQRFEDEYCMDESVPFNMKKPQDFFETFAGNTEEYFRVGLSICKNSVKLYSDFYKADILVTSPLGMRTIIGAEGENDREFDFLNSIEVLVLDQADIFLMQNWDHVLHLINHLHLQPQKSHGVDFSRVRMWSLNGWARYYRQTLLFSSMSSPELSYLFNKLCHNFSGKVKVTNPILSGSVCQVVVPLQQVFHRFDADSAPVSCEARFNFFLSKILPQYKDNLISHTLIFISSYFDFVRLRNKFKKDDVSFVQICEYTKQGKTGDGRTLFFHGRKCFMLFTERYHFYHRHIIKGIQHIVFYELPLFPHFYSDVCNFMQEMNQNPRADSGNSMTCSILFCKYDAHRLAAIVGTDRARLMIHSEKNVHMLVTGDM